MPARILAAALRRWWHEDSAQDLIEYALLVGLVAIVAASAVTQVGETIVGVFWTVIASTIPSVP